MEKIILRTDGKTGYMTQLNGGYNYGAGQLTQFGLLSGIYDNLKLKRLQKDNLGNTVALYTGIKRHKRRRR